jgi:hypothetical protein
VESGTDRAPAGPEASEAGTARHHHEQIHAADGMRPYPTLQPIFTPDQRPLPHRGRGQPVISGQRSA